MKTHQELTAMHREATGQGAQELHDVIEDALKSVEALEGEIRTVDDALRRVANNHLRQPYAGAAEVCVFCQTRMCLTHHSWCPMPGVDDARRAISGSRTGVKPS